MKIRLNAFRKHKMGADNGFICFLASLFRMYNVIILDIRQVVNIQNYLEEQAREHSAELMNKAHEQL